MVVVGMKELYRDEYFSISVDEEEGFLFYKIYGYPKFSEVIRHGHDELYRIAQAFKKDQKVLNLVADWTLAKILLTPDIRFIATVSYPRLSKAGLRNLVVLLPDDVHVKINLQKTIEFLRPNVFETVKQCSSLEEAREWLRSLA